jgi:hypothetical protein
MTKKGAVPNQTSIHECTDCGKMRPESDRHLTVQFLCGCGGGAIDLTGSPEPPTVGAGGGGGGLIPANFADVPENWTDPPPGGADPSVTKTRALIELLESSVEFQKVVVDFLEDRVKGYHAINARKKDNDADYHGNYIAGDIRSNPFCVNVTKVWRAQYLDKVLYQRLYEQELLAVYGSNGGADVVKHARMYHGTSEDAAFRMVGNGASRFHTTVPGYGKGVYLDPYGQISIHHARAREANGKSYILVCDLAYHKLGCTCSNSAEPPTGTDCGVCCQPSKKFPVPCIFVSFKDAQILVKYIIEVERAS